MVTSAGFFSYFVVMGEMGFFPMKLIGLRRSWDAVSINDLSDSYNQEWTYSDRKKLEHTCHTAYFVAIVVMQWFNVFICKTRRLSIFQHGIANRQINFAILFETGLTAFLCYTPGVDVGLNMNTINGSWWFPAIPFAILMFVYEETRKLIIRNQSPGSWLERETCY